MAYEVLNPAFYQYKQPGTPWHPGAPGWSKAPVPGWGMNPNLIGTPRIAVNGLGLTEQGVKFVKVGILAAAVGGLAYLLLGTGQRFAPPRLRRNPRRRRRRHRRNRGLGCRGRGAYLLPKEGKYPAPTKECLKTALAYASWPNNISDAGRVVRAARRTEWAGDPAIKAQINRLASKYKRETGKAA